MDPADRWHLTLAELLGQPLPPLPALRGRRHVMKAEARDALAEAWDRLHGPARSKASAWDWATSHAHEADR